MVLGQLQTLLTDLYALDVRYDVYDFLLTDARIAGVLDANASPNSRRPAVETLLPAGRR